MRLKVHHVTQARTVQCGCRRASGRAHRGSDHGPLSAALPSGIVDGRCPSGRGVSTGVGPPQDVHPGPGAGLGRDSDTVGSAARRACSCFARFLVCKPDLP